MTNRPSLPAALYICYLIGVVAAVIKCAAALVVLALGALITGYVMEYFKPYDGQKAGKNDK